MSEYRYYEFQALDRPLTRKEMEELRDISSRAQISSRRFVNEYNWGDLKADPERLMDRYFDAGLYLANWGSRWCMFRFPSTSLRKDELTPYCNKETVFCRFHKNHLTVSLDADIEEPDWIEGDDMLDAMLPLRESIVQGDLRALFIAWLRGIQEIEYDPKETDPEAWGYEDPVPPVPPGLGELTAPLKELVDFLAIDPDLLAAATEYSAASGNTAPTADEIARYVSALSQADKDAMLCGIISGDDPTGIAEFRQQALKFFRKRKAGHTLSPADKPLAVSTLLMRTQTIRDERRQRAAEKRAKAKAQRQRDQREQQKEHLASLIGREESLWGRAEALIAGRQPKHYDAAAVVLRDLSALAASQGTGEAFARRMQALAAAHSRKPSLIGRFRKVKLIE
ncbi:MAG: hypothetical protein JEZ11_06845 [Desulfobacterales bacterium]|nr:hypothetical protein [Desulfobacterales bacterium]